MSSPFLMIMLISLTFVNILSFLMSMDIFLGIIMLITCLPVQSGSGFKMAGIGSYPGRSSSGLAEFYFPYIQITRFIIYYLVKKVSLIVNKYTPSKASCTIPITGALFLGAMICLGTWAIFFNYEIV